jgi:1,4-alpha-glucan branching enzyme
MGLKSNEHISPQDVENAFLTAIAKQKLALGTIMTIPGPKMYFQGDDALDMSYFKFFRELSGDKYQRQNSEFVENIIREKGYDTLESVARPTCIVDKTEFRNPERRESMIKYNQDITTLMKEHPAISEGDIVATYCDNNNRIHIHHLMKGNEEILVIKNFGCGFIKYYGYGENFPDGDWVEILNSDSKEYLGSGEYTNRRWNPISRENQNLNIAPNSLIILKRL